MSDISLNTYAVYDDQSPSVHFSGPWIHYTLSGNEQVWNSTLSSAPNSGCSFSFDFSAAVLGIFGTILPANGAQRPVSSYSIDGASPSTFTPPDNVTERLDNQLFFVSDALATGVHTLSVTITEADGNDPFLIDYILVASASDTNTAESSAPTYMTTAIQGLPTATPQTLIESSSGLPAGAIVGGVVGGVALLVAVALAVFFLWNRRRRAVGAYYYHPADDLDHDLKPLNTATSFITPSTPSYDSSVRDSLVSMDRTSLRLSSATKPSRRSMLAGSDSGASSSYLPVTATEMAANRPRSKAEIAGILSVPPPTTYHTDARIRFGLSNSDEASPSTGQPQDLLIEAPPLYTES